MNALPYLSNQIVYIQSVEHCRSANLWRREQNCPLSSMNGKGDFDALSN